jgi:hypothetical protein
VIETPSAERYVAGKLSDEELALFEAAMIERPDLAADVAVRRRIKSGLALLEERKELDAFLKPARPASYIRFAAAAAVLVLAVGIVATWQRAAPPLQAMFNSSETGASHVAASFMLARTRSNEIPNFAVQRSGGLVRLRVVVEDPDAAPFAVSMIATAGDADTPKIKDSSVPKTTDGFAEIYLDPRELESGGYTLSLRSPSGAEQRFPFTLNVAP